jgi:DNA-3-methyladenine glycosylase
MILPVDFYRRATLDVARDLIGKVVVYKSAAGTTAGAIVEAEAYIGEDDPACHAAAGRTARNEPLYGPPGLAYVYVSYGQHHLLNAVTETAGFPAAVLIRALEPLEGLPLMRRRRARAPWRKGKGGVREAELCRGPGNLSRAMGISTNADNRRVLTRGVLTIRDEGIKTGELAWGSRIGITVGVDRQWRVVVAGHPSVSATRLANWGSDPDFLRTESAPELAFR